MTAPSASRRDSRSRRAAPPPMGECRRNLWPGHWRGSALWRGPRRVKVDRRRRPSAIGSAPAAAPPGARPRSGIPSLCSGASIELAPLPQPAGLSFLEHYHVIAPEPGGDHVEALSIPAPHEPSGNSESLGHGGERLACWIAAQQSRTRSALGKMRRPEIFELKPRTAWLGVGGFELATVVLRNKRPEH